MKNQHNSQQVWTDAFGLAVGKKLNGNADVVSHDVQERLRVSRLLALQVQKHTASVMTPLALQQGGGAATVVMGNGFGGWQRWASFLPLATLVIGLLLLNAVHDDFRAFELAELDAALLTDDLPPQAYTDPGFLQYVKLSDSVETSKD